MTWPEFAGYELLGCVLGFVLGCAVEILRDVLRPVNPHVHREPAPPESVAVRVSEEIVLRFCSRCGAYEDRPHLVWCPRARSWNPYRGETY